MLFDWVVCFDVRFEWQPRPLINKPPPSNRDYNRNPNIKALRKRGFINHGSTLLLPGSGDWGLIAHGFQDLGWPVAGLSARRLADSLARRGFSLDGYCLLKCELGCGYGCSCPVAFGTRNRYQEES